MTNTISLKPCPFCGQPAELEVKLPVYGFHGCIIHCMACQAKIQIANCYETRFSGDAISTPVTIESLSKCISSAVAAWNRRPQKKAEMGASNET